MANFETSSKYLFCNKDNIGYYNSKDNRATEKDGEY